MDNAMVGVWLHGRLFVRFMPYHWQDMRLGHMVLDSVIIEELEARYALDAWTLVVFMHDPRYPPLIA